MRRAVLVTASLLIIIATVGSASATQPMPSIPEFTVQFIDGSYIQTNTTDEPSTGETATNPTQYINNKTIQVSIKYEFKAIAFQQYDIRLRNHNIQEWTNIPSVREERQAAYTILTFAISGNNATGNFTSYLDKISEGDTVDVKVKEELWIERITGSDPLHYQYDYYLWKTSEWSNTQSITITENNTSPSPNPTTPYLPLNRNAPHLYPIFYLLPISTILAIAVIAFVIYRRKTSK